MKISELCQEAHKNAVEKGFYDSDSKNVGELLMLVVSELGEAFEAHRRGLYASYNNIFLDIDSDEDFESEFINYFKDTMQDELADAVIRIADMCQYLGIDLEKHIKLKMRYNKTRPYKHGKKY